MTILTTKIWTASEEWATASCKPEYKNSATGTTGTMILMKMAILPKNEKIEQIWLICIKRIQMNLDIYYKTIVKLFTFFLSGLFWLAFASAS